MSNTNTPSLILEALPPYPGSLSLQQLQEAIPHVGKQIIKNALQRMKARGQIERPNPGCYRVTPSTSNTPVTGTQVTPVNTAGVGMQDAPVENLVPKKKSRIRFGPSATIPATVPSAGHCYVRTPGVKQTPAGYVIPGKPLPLGCYVHPETILLTSIPEVTPEEAQALMDAPIAKALVTCFDWLEERKVDPMADEALPYVRHALAAAGINDIEPAEVLARMRRDMGLTGQTSRNFPRSAQPRDHL